MKFGAWYKKNEKMKKICLIFQWFQKHFTTFQESKKTYVCNDFFQTYSQLCHWLLWHFKKVSFDVCAGRFEGKFEGKIVKNTFDFSLIDVHLQKIFYDFLQFRIFCNCSYCMRGRRNVWKCDVCSRFFCWRFRYCLENRTIISPYQEWHSAPAYLWSDGAGKCHCLKPPLSGRGICRQS